MRRCCVPTCLSACLAFLLLSCQLIAGLEKKELPPADSGQEGDMAVEADFDGMDEGPQDPTFDPEPEPDSPEDPGPESDDAYDAPDPDALDLDEEPGAAAFRDDFDSDSLEPGWRFVNPLGDCSCSLALSPGHMVVSLPEDVTHDCWDTGNSCPRLVRSLEPGDWEVETSITGSAFLLDSSSVGIYFYQNDANFMRFEFFYGHGAISANAYSVIGGVGSRRLDGPTLSLQDSNHLKVVKVSNTYSFSYSLNGADWVEVGSVDEPGFIVRDVGIHVINYPPTAGTPPPIDVAVDHFSQTPL